MPCKFKVGDVVVRTTYPNAHEYCRLVVATNELRFTVCAVLYMSDGSYTITFVEDTKQRKTKFKAGFWKLYKPQRTKVYK